MNNTTYSSKQSSSFSWRYVKLSLALLVLLTAVVGLYAANSTSVRRANIILLSLDTLRADRLGAYGYARSTSPTLDMLAQRGVVFENAIAESSWTLPSHVTAFSGIHPLTHQVDNRNKKIAATLPLIPELLSAQSIATIGMADGGYLRRSLGFSRGFDQFTDQREPFSQKIERAKNLINQLSSDKQFFLFLHTYDIHCPYHPPEPYYSMFQTEGAQKIKTKKRCGATYFNKIGYTPQQATYISDRYDGNVRRTDTDLADFVSYLDKRNFFKNGYLIVFSDHGESFSEHGLIGHQRSLHKELLSVPLIVVGPGIKPGRVSDFVGLVDIAPTILELSGSNVLAKMQGHSLVPFLRNKKHPHVTLSRVSSLERELRLRSLMDSRWHLIWDIESNKKELYDLATDPGEQKDLSAHHYDLAEQMRADLERYSGAQPAAAAASEDYVHDAKELEQLKSLGYVN